MFLGFQELLLRGEEGRASLRALSDAGGFAGEVARAINSQSIGPHDVTRLEHLLGVERWGPLLDVEETDFLRVVGERIRAKGYSKKSIEELLMDQRVDEDFHKLHPHMDELLEEHVFTGSATFGAYEPVYLELLGPREILRLRTLPQGRFLLLGSLGKYSANNFGTFARKINPRLTTHVVDIADWAIEAITRNGLGTDHLVQGDARSLPFAPESFDHIYTNSLFHYLRVGEFFKTAKTQADIDDIMREAYAALKPGGSFVIIEQPYGSFKRQGARSQAMRDDVIFRATKAGFSSAVEFERAIAYALVPEYDSARIDENGFPHYEDGLILNYGERSAQAQLRFIKE